MPDNTRPFEAVLSCATKIYITLSNSDTIVLDMQDRSAVNLVTALNIEESTGSDSQHAAGVVSSNSLSININSLDSSLIPENSSSLYYGYMNDSARVRVEVKVGNDTVGFLRWFVKDWSSSISVSNPYSVRIDCVDQLGIAMPVPVAKNLRPYVSLNEDASTIFNEFMQSTSTKGLSGDTRFVLPSGSNSWNVGNYSPIHFFPCGTTISDMLNTFRQSLLYDMWNDRDGCFIVRDCLDFSSYSSVRVDDEFNVIDAKVNNTDLTNLNCIKCSYDYWSVEPESELVHLTDQTIESGESTEFSDVDLGGNIVSRLTQFKIDTKGDDQSSSMALTLSNDISKFNFTGSAVNFVILNQSDSPITADLLILGQKIKQSELSKTYGNVSASKALQINNRYILPEDVDRYLSNLYKLMGSRANSITVTGFFNPANLRVGDVVDVSLSTINISGRFKVVRISWDISSVIKGTLTLNKVVS